MVASDAHFGILPPSISRGSLPEATDECRTVGSEKIESVQSASFNFQLPYPSISERSLREAINQITYGWRQRDGVYSIRKFLFPTS